MKRALVAALAAGAALFAAQAFAEQVTIPDLVNGGHTTKETKAFFNSYYTAKSNRDLAGTMAHFSKDGMTYIDAILGWPLYSWDQLNGLFTNIMPKWPASARSYPTRVLGDMHSAVIAFTDTPELFGGEIRIYSAVDFKDGKIVRQIDYWDGRNFGVALANKMRTPPDKFPTDFKDNIGDQASPGMQTVAKKLHDALAKGDAKAAAALFSYDGVYEDMTLHSKIVGSKAIDAYFGRALGKLPWAAGSSLIHVLGSDQGGGFEWMAAPSFKTTVKRGITALELDHGKITRMSVMWDSSLVGDGDFKPLATLAVD
jgi:ketosteroid isomerase-like protein